MRVEQMINNRGNGAMNQFVITDAGRMVFQSYNSTIVDLDYDHKIITIGKDYNYSTTTGKHRNIFFANYAYMPELATLKGLEKAMQAGTYDGWTVRKGA